MLPAQILEKFMLDCLYIKKEEEKNRAFPCKVAP